MGKKIETCSPESETQAGGNKKISKQENATLSIITNNEKKRNKCQLQNRQIKCKRLEYKDNCMWGSRMTRKLLKMQLISIIIILWFGIAIYGCDFPAKTVLNQVLIFLYFFIIYSVGVTFGYYVLDSPTILGMRIFTLFQAVTIVASGIFEFLSLNALNEHAVHDLNPLTRVWAANMYAAVILANTLVLATAIGLAITSFANSGVYSKDEKKVQNKNGSRKSSRELGSLAVHAEDETTHCLNNCDVEENGV